MPKTSISRLLDLTEFEPYKINLVECSCGSGKTYFALHKLPLLTNIDFIRNLDFAKTELLFDDSNDEKAFQKLLDLQDLDAVKPGNTMEQHFQEANMDWDLPATVTSDTFDDFFDNGYRRIVYLIDTAAGRDQIIRHYDICRQYEYEWRKRLPHDFWGEVDTRMVVMTYHMFGLLCLQDGNWYEKIDLLICDEIHNLYEYYLIYGKKEHPKDSPNPISMAYNTIMSNPYLEKIEWIVGLTATPEILQEDHEYPNQFHLIPIHGEIEPYTDGERVEFSQLYSLCTHLPVDKRGIIYTPLVRSIIQCRKILLERGITAEGIWSPHHEKHPMTDDQIRLRNDILETERIPEKYQILLINKSCETSINITGEIDYMVINTTDESEVVQARGRYRGNLEKCFYRHSEWKEVENEIFVPDEYLNRPITNEDIKKIIADSYLLDESNRSMKPPTFKRLARKAGYIVLEGKRINNKRTTVFKTDDPYNWY